MPWNGVEPKRPQLELTPLAHLSLNLRERRHPRLELLARDDGRCSIQLSPDIRERQRGRRTTVPTPTSVAEKSSALVRRWLWGW
jgi:hypothetical protein